MIMSSILELSRHERLVQRELLRRIGYTNGLHDIYRFARVVEYLYPRIPSTQTALRSIIIREETEKGLSRISGNDYAQGIIDVAGALLLIDKSGQKLSLSDRGYALHALEQQNLRETYRRAFLLMSILDADGEYFLNLLDMLTQGIIGTIELGRDLLNNRVIKIIDLKEQWGKTSIHSSVARDIILRHLQESRRVLKEAMDPSQKVLTKSRSVLEERKLSPERRVERFLEHTVTPRLGWLVDLGCARKDDSGHLVATEQGQQLLDFFKDSGCLRESVYVLPVSPWLAKVLDAKNPTDATDLSWRAVAATLAGCAEPCRYQGRELLDRIKSIYPHVKLYGFNQADISSVLHVLSCMESVDGKYIHQDRFDEDVASLVKNFPKEIFGLSKRRGRGGYIALKKQNKQG
jgi:hypothetical protein